ncbi:MAG: glycosyltransferase family 9 protein [Saprospiraceae bacterium]|nr:glycosyltransferase family 9 protein [Saprospiraceae bacterium]
MRKILIIRFSSIGDIVLTTPVIRCLRKQLGAEIHFITKQQYLPLLEANPYLDKIFTIRKKVSEVLPLLKKEHYDCIIDLHKNIRSMQIRWALTAKTYAFNKLNVEKWLLVHCNINRLPNIHIVDRYLAATAPLGIKNDGQGLDYFFPPNYQAHNLPFTIHHSPFVAFAIGATFQTKRLPTEKIIEICKGSGQPVVLLGGKNEQEAGNLIAQEAGRHVLNLCGKLTLHESAEVISQAAKVITHDTGMMHIAAAFQKEILSIWGNTVPALGMWPYYGNGSNRNKTFEVQNLSCRPCSKLGFDKCPKGHFKCMIDIPVPEILVALSK